MDETQAVDKENELVGCSNVEPAAGSCALTPPCSARITQQNDEDDEDASFKWNCNKIRLKI
jgi:hypothetical protein